MIPIAKVIVSSTEPTGKNRKKVWMKKGKNFLNLNSLGTKTLNGVTITENEDGSITLNGTATIGFTAFKIPINLSLKAGKYTHSLKNIEKGIYLSLDNITETMIGSKDNIITSQTFELIEDTEFENYQLWINSGVILNNLKIFPMLCVGTDTTYEKYIEPKIYIKNSNDVYEEFINKKELENKITGLEDNVEDLQTKYNNFLKPLELGFGTGEQLKKTFELTKKGSAFVSVMPNGYNNGEAYILFFGDKNTLTKVNKILGDSSTLQFSISNGILIITSSVAWSSGFIIFNS